MNINPQLGGNSMRGQMDVGAQYITKEPKTKPAAERHTQTFEELAERLSSINVRLHNVRRRIMGPGDMDKEAVQTNTPTAVPGNFDAVLNEIQDRQRLLIDHLDAGVSELERWVGA